MKTVFRYAAGVVQHTWTSPEGHSRGIIKDPEGQHHTVFLPFGVTDGDNVRLVDGTWRAARAAQ